MEINKYMRGEEGAPDGGLRRKAVGEERIGGREVGKRGSEGGKEGKERGEGMASNGQGGKRRGKGGRWVWGGVEGERRKWGKV